ncbi:RraA family protein [Anaerosinus massiliensis]|uniref:RraA family protein n=1 Tax=Massilibacillus massiliensis TaxID=1806837 RepID=UPI000A776317|nr:RraA family protein [Massilibacillus massiliensis]
MSNIGYRIYNTIHRPPRELVEGFAEIPVANIADNMNRLACIDARIRPMNNAPLLGTAFTIKTRPGNNLLLHKALDMAKPGDVIVVAAQGRLENAITGELMISWAKERGIAGLIIDGAIRDAAAVRKMDIPVYAAGVTPNGPYKDPCGEINAPVSCGGIVINPGDILVGDADSVVVIDPKDAEELLAKSREVLAKETVFLEEIHKGKWDRTWVDKMLRDTGCEFID